MKKIYLIIAVAVVIAVSILCYFLLPKNAEQRNVVPDDATAVMTLDVRALIEESGIDINELRSVDNTTGIEFSQTIYGFVTRDGYVGISAAVADESDLEHNMSDIHSSMGMTWGMMGSWLVCTDEDKLLMMGPLGNWKDEALKQTMSSLMKKGTTTSVLLDSVEQQKSPLSFRIDTECIPNAYRKLMSLGLPEGIGLDELQLAIDTRVSEDKIQLITSVKSENPRIKKFMDHWLSVFKPMKGGLVPCSPQNAVVWLGVGMNGETLLEELRKVDYIRTYLLGLNMCIDADLAIKSIDGDVALSIPSLNMRGMDYLFHAELKDTHFLANSSDWGSSALALNFERRGPNDFLITTPEHRAFFGVTSTGELYVTNNTGYIPNGLRPEIGYMSSYVNEIRGAKMFLSLNLSSLLNTAAPLLMVLGYSPGFYSALGELDRLNLRVDDKNQEIEITLKRPVRDVVRSWLK